MPMPPLQTTRVTHRPRHGWQTHPSFWLSLNFTRTSPEQWTFSCTALRHSGEGHPTTGPPRYTLEVPAFTPSCPAVPGHHCQRLQVVHTDHA